ENAMVGHPKVNQAAVVGLEHPKWHERPLMPLVLHDGEEITTEEVHEHLLESFAKWQLPEQFQVVDEIPTTSVGKLDKKVIRIQYGRLSPDAAAQVADAAVRFAGHVVPRGY